MVSLFDPSCLYTPHAQPCAYIYAPTSSAPLTPELTTSPRRDPFPKLDLHGAYVGDKRPLCAGLPKEGWLKEGAKFLYRGPELTNDLKESFAEDSVVTLRRDSKLSKALCGKRDKDGLCSLSSVVRLATDLHYYDGDEYKSDNVATAPRLFRLQSEGGGGNYYYFEYQRPTCVELTFDATVATVVTVDRKGWLSLDNQTYFRVAWDGGFPTAAARCTSASDTDDKSCVADGDVCVCNVKVMKPKPVFDRAPATAVKLEEECHITQQCRWEYPSSMYRKIGENGEVKVYAQKNANQDEGVKSLGPDAIFRVKGSSTCYSNQRSMVRVAGFKFRNAPHFVSFTTPTAADAEAETEAVLDHLFYHKNTAPFVARRFIQRFTTSNPSPRYTRRVANAFRTGKYKGFGSGSYGDLSAMVAAVLLDREARATTLDADPAHGVLREPLLLLHHVMRSLEFVSADGREVEMPNIEQDIGMEAHRSPSVFNFYQPDYSPSGALGDAGLYAPEAGLATAPRIMGLLNGLSSLVDYGLSACASGFGRTCAKSQLRKKYLVTDGQLEFAPQGENTSAVVSELDLLLTAGRLNPKATAIMKEAYDSYKPSKPAEALKMVQKLFFATAEFRTTNFHVLTGGARNAAPSVDAARPAAPLSPPLNKTRFKAVVVRTQAEHVSSMTCTMWEAWHGIFMVVVYFACRCSSCRAGAIPLICWCRGENAPRRRMARTWSTSTIRSAAMWQSTRLG